MLTRLKVSGFKNLVDIDIRFGPFTCIAGPNTVGKSNLFDAIRFLSYLANDTLLNAALSIRSDAEYAGDVRSLFHRMGDSYAESIAFEAEMILPDKCVDDLGQNAKSTDTFVRYSLRLDYREHGELPPFSVLEVLSEELEPIERGDADEALRFPHSPDKWRRSVVRGKRISSFILTAGEDEDRVIKLAADGNRGRSTTILANNLPRSVLSTVNAIENPTALLARQEMRSWHLLQLEPAVLRQHDSVSTWPGIQSNGAHLPATLYYLAQRAAATVTHGATNGTSYQPTREQIYEQIAARLSEVDDEVYLVDVDRDEKREILTLQLSDRNGTRYTAHSISDGTLRFLALATIELDSKMHGLLCLEEPENGFHPGRIPAVIRLLEDIACDVFEPVGPDNPLRQVIINTHSPAVVQQVPDDSLLMALPKQIVKAGERFRSVSFGWLPDTWRCDADPEIFPAAKGSLLAYLNPAEPRSVDDENGAQPNPRRVIDRPDLQMALPFPDPYNERSSLHAVI